MYQVLKPGTPLPDLPSDAGEDSVARYDAVRHANGAVPTPVIRDKMQRVMQNHAAVYRTGDSLKEGCEKIDEIYGLLKDVKVTDRSSVW